MNLAVCEMASALTAVLFQGGVKSPPGTVISITFVFPDPSCQFLSNCSNGGGRFPDRGRSGGARRTGAEEFSWVFTNSPGPPFAH